jgi:transmembrane sensor
VVQVKTGKVSVFARNDSRANEMKANRELEGVVLTPNQQLAFSRSDVRMKKSLVSAPLPVHPQRFEFKDEPVITHFFGFGAGLRH